MSDLLESAATALGTPPTLVQRAAAARASASGSTVDEILAAWAGGAPVKTQAPEEPASVSPEPTVEAGPDPSPSPEIQMPAAAVATMEYEIEYEILEEEETLEPVAIGTRVRTAVRVGAWTGAALGLIGFLAATAFWSSNATLAEDGRTVFETSTSGALIGFGLVSIVFGAIVASLSRAAASWRDPAMQLTGPRSTTGWIGAGIGLVLGVTAGALLTGVFGTASEMTEGAVQLPVLATLGVMLVGGAVLGALTSSVPQIFGTPVAVDEADEDEIIDVRTRLGQAVTIPLGGTLMLVVFVLPFAFLLFEANHLLAGAGAAIVAIVVAGGILGFSALAGSKPNMRITLGEVIVAAIGIGTVTLVILAVIVFRS